MPDYRAINAKKKVAAREAALVATIADYRRALQVAIKIGNLPYTAEQLLFAAKDRITPPTLEERATADLVAFTNVEHTAAEWDRFAGYMLAKYGWPVARTLRNRKGAR